MSTAEIVFELIIILVISAVFVFVPWVVGVLEILKYIFS